MFNKTSKYMYEVEVDDSVVSLILSSFELISNMVSF
jgi:hypothetical protein